MNKPSRRIVAYQAPAVDKALDVMELLAVRPEGASMKEIATALGRSMSELYRMVLALENRGYVLKNEETERYHLTLRMFALAHRHPPVARLVQAALPILEDLAAQALQSCHLAVAEGKRLVVIATAECPMPMRYGVKTGASFPLLETGSGAVLAAYGRPEATNAAMEGWDDAARADMAVRFEGIRARGYEVRASSVVDGVTNISVAVHDHRAAAAALTVPYLRQAQSHPGLEAATHLTVTAAARLSSALGYAPSLLGSGGDPTP